MQHAGKRAGVAKTRVKQSFVDRAVHHHHGDLGRCERKARKKKAEKKQHMNALNKACSGGVLAAIANSDLLDPGPQVCRFNGSPMFSYDCKTFRTQTGECTVCKFCDEPVHLKQKDHGKYKLYHSVAKLENCLDAYTDITVDSQPPPPITLPSTTTTTVAMPIATVVSPSLSSGVVDPGQGIPPKSVGVVLSQQVSAIPSKLRFDLPLPPVPDVAPPVRNPRIQTEFQRPLPDVPIVPGQPAPKLLLDGSDLTEQALVEMLSDGVHSEAQIIEVRDAVIPWIGEKRPAHQRNVTAIDSPMRVRAVLSVTGGWTAFLAFQAILCFSLSIMSIVCDVFAFLIRYDMCRRNFDRSFEVNLWGGSSAGLAVMAGIICQFCLQSRTNNKRYWWIIVGGVLSIAKAWCPFVPSALVPLIQLIVILVSSDVKQSTEILYYVPHLATCLYMQYLHTPTSAATLDRTLVQRAATLACLPFRDASACAWLHGTVRVASYMIRSYDLTKGFPTSRVGFANFGQAVDLT